MDFYEGLATWVESFISEAERRREKVTGIQRRESEIEWLCREVTKLELKMVKRSSAGRQLAHYRKQIRQREIEIAFIETA